MKTGLLREKKTDARLHNYEASSSEEYFIKPGDLFVRTYPDEADHGEGGTIITTYHGINSSEKTKELYDPEKNPGVLASIHLEDRCLGFPTDISVHEVMGKTTAGIYHVDLINSSLNLDANFDGIINGSKVLVRTNQGYQDIDTLLKCE